MNTTRHRLHCHPKWTAHTRRHRRCRRCRSAFNHPLSRSRSNTLHRRRKRLQRPHNRYRSMRIRQLNHSLSKQRLHPHRAIRRKLRRRRHTHHLQQRRALRERSLALYSLSLVYRWHSVCAHSLTGYDERIWSRCVRMRTEELLSIPYTRGFKSRNRLLLLLLLLLNNHIRLLRLLVMMLYQKRTSLLIVGRR